MRAMLELHRGKGKQQPTQSLLGMSFQELLIWVSHKIQFTCRFACFLFMNETDWFNNFYFAKMLLINFFFFFLFLFSILVIIYCPNFVYLFCFCLCCRLSLTLQLFTKQACTFSFNLHMHHRSQVSIVTSLVTVGRCLHIEPAKQSW